MQILLLYRVSKRDTKWQLKIKNEIQYGIEIQHNTEIQYHIEMRLRLQVEELYAAKKESSVWRLGDPLKTKYLFNRLK